MNSETFEMDILSLGRFVCRPRELNLEAFIRDVLVPLLDRPEELVVEIKTGDKQTDILLWAPQADRGRIIGRNGRMISALRTLCRAAGQRRGLTITLELMEEDGRAGAARPSESTVETNMGSDGKTTAENTGP